jgi:hypothetical protein
MNKIVLSIAVYLAFNIALATNVSGYMTQSTTWTPDNNPYIVTGFLYILPGVTLTIMPDVQVLITAADKNNIFNFFWNGNTQPLGKSIIVQGRIIAIGTARQPIVFDKYSHNPNAKWGVIHMVNGAPKSYFEHCEFRNSFYCWINPQDYYADALSFSNGSIHVRHCLFESNYGAVAGLMQSDVLIYNCRFKSYNNIDYPPPFAFSKFIFIGTDLNNPPAQYYNLTIAKCTFSGYSQYTGGYGYLNKLYLFNRFEDYHNYDNEPQRLNEHGITSSYGNYILNSDVAIGGNAHSAADTAYCRRNTLVNMSSQNYQSNMGSSSNSSADDLGNCYVSDNIIKGNGYIFLDMPHRANVWCNNNLIETKLNSAIETDDYQNFFAGNVMIFNNVVRGLDNLGMVFINTSQTIPKAFNNTVIGFNEMVIGAGAVYFTNNIFQDIYHPPNGNSSGWTVLYTSNCLDDPFLGSVNCDGGGNIVANPLFVNGDSLNYQLSPDSPCIDSGAPIPELPGYDARYYVRSMPAVAEGPRIVDMGAFEYNSVYIGGIEGYVYDAATNQPLDCAKISISGKLPEYSDTLGLFIFHTGAGTYTIKVTRWDYSDVIIPNVVIVRGQTTPLQIALQPLTMGIDDETIVAEPVQITLYNYPNPFKTETKISYVLHQAGLVNLEIYNVKGQKIKSLSMGEKKAGLQSLSWDGRDSKGNPCASGVYFCKMQFNNKSVSKKLILMK